MKKVSPSPATLRRRKTNLESFRQIFAQHLNAVETNLISYWQEQSFAQAAQPSRLIESITYSLLSPGKRFRPVLALLTAEAVHAPTNLVLPFACSVEFIHAYSLIHDDLPCMDDDDIRRGKPTNHM